MWDNMGLGKKPVVLHFASWYPTKEKPMLGIFIRKHIILLQKDLKQGVIYFNISAQFKEGLKIVLNDEDNLNEIEIRIKKNSFFKLIFIAIGFFKAIKLFNNKIGSPQIVHLHTILPMASLVWFFVKLNRVKLVVTEHWTGYQPEDGNYKGAFRKLFTKLIIKNADTVITVSKQLAEAMGKHSLKFKNVVISNAVDLQVFKVSDKKINPNNFIHISSLDDRQKNTSGIIRAFAEVVKQNNQTQLIIVGSGGDEMELRKLVGDFGLSSQVVFVGNKKGVELASLIKDSAALIMFSRYENQPVVILEALACGTPVISTYVGGIAEMLDESNSLKVEVENVQQLKASMELILNDNKFFDAEQIQENILKTIHPDIIRNKHLELYKELLN